MANLTLISCYVLDVLTCGLLAGERRTVANHQHARPVEVSRINHETYRVDVVVNFNGKTIKSPSFVVRRTRTGYLLVSAQFYRIQVTGEGVTAAAETLHFDAIAPGHVKAIEQALVAAKTMHGLTLDEGPRTAGDNAF